MTEQMDHRAAIESAVAWTAPDNRHFDESDNEHNLALAYLASIKAAWPGVVPPENSRNSNDLWRPESEWYGGDLNWCDRANKFERDYPGLKVDDPWLQSVMEGVKLASSPSSGDSSQRLMPQPENVDR